MNCFPEFTYSVYADGELPLDEARQVEAHLATCPACRILLDSLRAENHMLSTVFADAREELETLPELQRASPSRLILGAIGALAGSVLALRTVFVGILNWGLSQLGFVEPASSALDWLNPSSWTAQFNLFFSSVFYLVTEGGPMLLRLLSTIASIIVVLAVISGGYLLMRRRPTGAGTLAMMMMGMLAAIFGVSSASAATVHHAETGYSLPKGQTLNDTLILGGDNAIIDGDVNGDVIFGGRKLVIHGNIKGDVFSGNQVTEIHGTVSGNVIVFSQRLSLDGKVGGSVYAWTQGLEQSGSSVIAGDLLSFSADSDQSGEIGRDLMMFTGFAHINGKVGRNVLVRGDNMVVGSSAKVNGDLEARLRHSSRARIESGASISGKQSITQEVRGDDDGSRYMQGRFYFWQFIQFLAALLMGTLLLFLMPDVYRGSVDAIGSSGSALLRSLGLGFAILCAGPIAIVLLMITLIGIPVGIALFMFWMAGFYFAKIFLAAVVGQAVLQRAPQSRQDALVTLLIGLAIFYVAVNLPYAIGTVLYCVVLCVGLGGFGYRLATGPKKQPEPVLAI